MARRYWTGGVLPTLALSLLLLILLAPHWKQQVLLQIPTPAAAAPACSSMAAVSAESEDEGDRRGIAAGSDSVGRGIVWHAQRGRYLILICNSGQVTNHLVCLRKHMYMAALLNRTLVLPPASLDYQYAHLLDLDHLQLCLGNSTVIPFEAFLVHSHHPLHIAKLVCFMPDCYFDREQQSKWEATGFTFGPPQDADAGQPRGRDAVLARFASTAAAAEAVIAVGDLFYAEIEDLKFAVPPTPTPTPLCQRLLLRPHPSIVESAQRFVQTYLGSNFVAVHFRRHGFLVFCNQQTLGPSCFYPIPQAAQCIAAKVRQAGSEVVFLSTDAAESEASALVAMLQQRHGVVVVRRPAAHEALAKWDALLWRQAGREAEAGVMALLDQAICSLAGVFVGTRASTFSAHIQSLRRAMATASSCDETLCHAEQEPPSFIASRSP